MHDGKSLQAGTSHYLGQNFAKAFDIKYLDKDGALKYVYTSSWGVSTRLIGAIIMAHGDQRGLCLPPVVAPVQAVIVPIAAKKAGVMEKCAEVKQLLLQAGVRVELDDSDNSPGWKFNEWEMKGVPLRIELGPRDIEAGKALVFRRDRLEKTEIALGELAEGIKKLLDTVQKDMLEAARERRDKRIVYADDMAGILKGVEGGNFVKAGWCGCRECEDKVKGGNRRHRKGVCRGRDGGKVRRVRQARKARGHLREGVLNTILPIRFITGAPGAARPFYVQRKLRHAEKTLFFVPALTNCTYHDIILIIKKFAHVCKRREMMKNKAKKFVALLLCTGLVASAAALSACGDGRGAILIEGDFSTEATVEQRAEVLEKVSSFSQHDMFEVEGESTSRNVRMYSDGVIGMEMSASQEGMSMNYSMDMDVSADHTITIASEQDVRGSGTMSFAMGMNVQISGAGADSMNENMEMSFSGNTYNDVSYMYIDGSMSVTASGQSATQDGKFKMDFNSIFDQVMAKRATCPCSFRISTAMAPLCLSTKAPRPN